MPFDINHPSCIIKIILFASVKPEDPFLFEQVSPEFFDCIEPHAASAVIKNLNVKKLGGIRFHSRKGPVGFLPKNTFLTDGFDSRPFWNCDEIKTRFLIRSQNLTCIDFSGNSLQNVRKIGSFFLYCSPNLQRVNFETFKNVEEIGCYFLAGCSSLTALDHFAELGRNLKNIDDHFLHGVVALKKLDFSGSFGKVEKIDDSFLRGCTGLEEIDGLCSTSNASSTSTSSSSLFLGANTRKIEGGYFLAGCSSLRHVRVGFPKLERVHAGGFCERCVNLEIIDFRGLNPKVQLWAATAEFRKDHNLMDPASFDSPKFAFYLPPLVVDRENGNDDENNSNDTNDDNVDSSSLKRKLDQSGQYLAKLKKIIVGKNLFDVTDDGRTRFSNLFRTSDERMNSLIEVNEL